MEWRQCDSSVTRNYRPNELFLTERKMKGLTYLSHLNGSGRKCSVIRLFYKKATFLLKFIKVQIHEHSGYRDYYIKKTQHYNS